MVEVYFEFYYRLHYTRIANRKLGEGAIKCQSVVKAIHPVSFFRIFYTANRHWLMNSLQRIKDAGLDAKWKEYGVWSETMLEKNKVRGLTKKGGLGLIEMLNFTPIIALWATVALLAATVLLFEVDLLGKVSSAIVKIISANLEKTRDKRLGRVLRELTQKFKNRNAVLNNSEIGSLNEVTKERLEAIEKRLNYKMN